MKLPFTSGISSKDVMFFTSQLSMLLETGSNLTESLGAISRQTQNPRLGDAISTVSMDVTSGKMLSTALGSHPKIFSPVFVSMIRAGEMGGFLSDMLTKMAEFLKLQEGLKSKVKAALAYPAILSFISMGVAVFMVTFVLPNFMVVFEGKEDILPMTTKILIAIADALTSYWMFIVPGIAGAIAGVVMLSRTSQGRKVVDFLKLRTPVVGGLFRSGYSARLLRTLGVMLESGIPLLDGIEVTRGTVGSGRYKQFLDTLSNNVQQGRSLAEPFVSSSLFPPAVKQMITTAEMTGSSGVVMIRLADYYDEEVENNLRSLTAMLEPAIIVVMGGVVGFIALSLFMPLFKLSRGVM